MKNVSMYLPLSRNLYALAEPRVGRLPAKPQSVSRGDLPIIDLSGLEFANYQGLYCFERYCNALLKNIDAMYLPAPALPSCTLNLIQNYKKNGSPKSSDKASKIVPKNYSNELSLKRLIGYK